MVELDKLAVEISTLAEKIKSLKAEASVDKDAVGKAVAELLTLKQTYAENNNGIGVDGKPLEKKAKAKESTGPTKLVS